MCVNFVVGDIHGEITKLRKLCNHLLKKYSDVQFVFIGDYLDKGEDVLSTIAFLSDLSKTHKCTFLYGNHEYYWFLNKDESSETYLHRYGGSQTLKSFNANTVTETRDRLASTFPEFISSLQPYWKSGKFIAVHSGIEPGDYSLAIEKIPLERLLFNRYEFLSHQGLYMNEYVVIFGHTGFYHPFYDKFKIGIDTSACFLPEQPLTAFSPELGTFVNSDGKSYPLNGLPLNQCPVIPRNKPWRENDSLA